MKYDLVSALPVARFYYKGNHTHPVKRTILVIESNKNILRGYELREGNITRSFSKAPIKSYTRSKIAKGNNLRVENPIRKNNPKKSTLIRRTLINLIEIGA